MPQQRLSIDLSEILHFEIYCPDCQYSTTLPLEDSSGILSRFNSYQCPSCQKPFESANEIQAVLYSIREGLAFYRKAQSELAIRLVVQIS
jgi:transposase-like protein